jgi:FkbM family methyltransferase
MLRDLLLSLFFRRRWRGFETLFRVTGRRHILARNRYGALFSLDPHEYVDSFVLRDGFYESEVFETLLPALGPGAVFWDIGSCFGLHAVTAATIKAGVVVEAFEPNPSTCTRIQQNAELNRASVRLWPFALDERDGITDLYLSAAGNSGMTTVRPRDRALFTRAGTVATARADTLIATGRIQSPTVVKLDVEGSEAAVLRGFGSSLSDPRLHLIVLECAAEILADSGGNPLRLLLLDAGFRLHGLSRNEATAHGLINVAATRVGWRL